jgi:hypothetical protein
LYFSTSTQGVTTQKIKMDISATRTSNIMGLGRLIQESWGDCLTEMRDSKVKKTYQ